MSDQPPQGQGPIDPNSAFGPPGMPPPPGGGLGGRPMPMMMAPPPVRAVTPNAGWSFLTALATILFGLSVVANVVLVLIVFVLAAVNAGSAAADPVLRTQLVDGGADRIAVVPVEGIIEGNMARRVQRYLDLAAEDDSVKAVVLSIDSPGGGVTPSDEIHHAVEAFKRDTGKPVVALFNSLAASGGYYVACATDEIIAQPTSLTGSIGVLLARYDLSGFGEKYGIADGSIVSTGADFKTAGDIFTELSDGERDYLTSVIDDSFETFKRVVKDGRSSQLAEADSAIEDVANGKIFSAQQALALGLIDAEGYAEDAFAAAAARAGVTNPTVIRYDRPPTTLELLGAEATGGGFELDATLVDELTTPRLQYLWRGR